MVSLKIYSDCEASRIKATKLVGKLSQSSIETSFFHWIKDCRFDKVSNYLKISISRWAEVRISRYTSASKNTHGKLIFCFRNSPIKKKKDTISFRKQVSMVKIFIPVKLKQ